MLELFGNTILGMLLWLSAHTAFAYAFLFFGSFFETLIGSGFFIYGEMIFLPGAILAGTGVLNVWLVAFWLISGGVLGDSASFFIGRKFGARLFKEHNRFFSLTNYKKGEDFILKYGAKSVFFARLLGPLSWITPFFSGIYKMSYPRFLAFNIPGVTVGIGEFIIVGYIFGQSYQKALTFVQEKITTLIFGAFFLFLLYYIWKRNDPDFFSEKWSWKAFYRRYISKKV